MNQRSLFLLPELKKALTYMLLATGLFWIAYAGAFLPAFASATFVFWGYLFLYRTSQGIPLKELLLMFYSLQYLMGPCLSYMVFDEFNAINIGGTYRMRYDRDLYFGYAIPAFWALVLGIQGFKRTQKLNYWNLDLQQFSRNAPQLPVYFMIIGFLSDLIYNLLPSELQFVGYLFSNLKYVGLILYFFTRTSYRWLIFFVVYGFLLASAFRQGMFHDLVIWTVFIGLSLSFRFQLSTRIKILYGLVFFVALVILQSTKSVFREFIWGEGQVVSASVVGNAAGISQQESGGFFSFDNLATHSVRINQGWMLASTLSQVPSNEAHAGGSLNLAYLQSAILPRFLAPNKMNAGDKVVFNKYSGHEITTGTSMALGLFADGYIDFGYIGGILYVGLFGVLLAWIIKFYLRKSVQYPVLIYFLFIVFLYPVRPDCETQTTLGNLFKSSVLVILILNFGGHYLKLRRT